MLLYHINLNLFVIFLLTYSECVGCNVECASGLRLTLQQGGRVEAHSVSGGSEERDPPRALRDTRTDDHCLRAAVAVLQLHLQILS